MRETKTIRELTSLIRYIISKDANYYSVKAIHDIYEDINRCAVILQTRIKQEANKTKEKK